MGNEDYSRLIDRIKQVFDSVQSPGDENILGAPEHVQSCGECSLLQTALVGRKWQDLADDESSSGYVSHAMSFFSPSGWHYYLPAYLIQTVKGRTFTSMYFQTRIGTIGREMLEKRMKLLTRDQCRVIIAYLLIVLRENRSTQSEVDSNVEAVTYWKQMCQEL